MITVVSHMERDILRLVGERWSEVKKKKKKIGVRIGSYEPLLP